MPTATAAQAHQLAPAARRGTQRGETLGTIAKHWYGDSKRYKDIFEANKGILKSADAVEVGQALTIPLIDPKVSL